MKGAVIAFVAVVLVLLACGSQAGPQNPAAGQKSTAAPSSKATLPKEGERRFQANCGRCHNPPDSLSPREVKAVLQHMRVRAMLSAEDEQLILKYLAP
jgi:mono/diheme cytochrome c family protein